MSDLNAIEKRKIERALGMASGYVLNFSNRTFQQFFFDAVAIDIYDPKYANRGGSKANRLRGFWDIESNYLVGKVLGILFDEWNEFKVPDSPPTPPDECIRIVRRLQESAPIPDISALVPNAPDETFETLAKSVRESIERNEPETGLDRLHTFLVKYFRSLCAKRGIDTNPEKPLHSLTGEYIKALKSEGAIESEMTERILKSSISVMEAFNRVRNDHSLAHDNKILNYDESLLICAHVTSSIRFIEAIEKKASDDPRARGEENVYDDIPF
jgi:hypothetical protein